MDQAAECARMREFIEERGLTAEYEAHVAEHQRRTADASTPAVDVSYQNVFHHRDGDEEQVSITPWLRTASLEDACRFARLVREEVDTRGDEDGEDGEFLADAVEDCLDEDEIEWFRRADRVRVMLYSVRDDLLRHLPEIRPNDHEEVARHLAAPVADAASAGDVA